MILSGDGFDSFNLRIKPGFKPSTKLAVKWKQLANGSYIAVDRGVKSDIYETSISAYGKDSEIDGFLGAMEKNRNSGNVNSNIFRLTDFNHAEMIFGAEIDYDAGISAFLSKVSEKEQKSWKGFSLKLTLRATELIRQNIPGVFPEINNLARIPAEEPESPGSASLQIGYTADSVIELEKADSYYGLPYFSDYSADSGFFEGNLILKTEDMAKLRTFLIENRGEIIAADSDAGEIINNIPGVESLFGKRRQLEGPFDTRIIEWQDMGMKDLEFWSMKLKIVEDCK